MSKESEETSIIIGMISLVGTITTVLTPIIFHVLPTWEQKYHEWSVSSSERLKLNDESCGELRDRLQKSLSCVKGQDSAINTVIDSICGWDESKKNDLDSKSGGLIIHMAGASGTGKSMAANIISNELSKNSTIKISYSNIDTTSDKSCAEQLFGVYERLSFDSVHVECNTDHSAKLMRNSNVIVQIDEFEKFMIKDDSLQALLWDIADTGKLSLGKDKYIDCSNTIFLLTSNVSRESLKMKIDEAENDDSDSLESVNFKQAFLNRITSVYFENFSEETYKEILLTKLDPIKKYYSSKYNVTLNFSDDTINKITKKLTSMKTGGARNVGIFTKKLYSSMSSFKKENNISESCNQNTYNVDVFYNDDKFDICFKQ